MASPYDALLDAQPTNQSSEYDALLEQSKPQSGVGQALENAGAAALNVAKGFVKGFLPKFDTKSLVEIAFAPAAVASQTMQAAEGAIDAVKQVGEAEKTPAWSRERFEAGFNVAGQLAMIAGIKGGVEAAYRAPVTDVASVVNKEVIDNAVKERNIQESVQPKRAGDGEVGTSRETSGGSSVQPETQVPAQEAPLEAQITKKIASGETIHVTLIDGTQKQVAPFAPITPEGDIALADGNTVSRDAVKEVAPVPQPEQPTVDPISAAAYKLPNGKIYTGRIHIEALRAAEDDLGHPLNPSELQSGFVTKGGQFMNNAEAMRYATETKQIDKSEYDLQGKDVEGYISPSNLEAGRFNQVKRIPSEIQTPEKSTTIPSEERTVNKGEISIKEVQTKPELAQSEVSPVPKVNVSDVAQSLPQKEVGGGGVQPPAAPPVATSSTEPTVSAIANRFVAERAAKGGVGEIAPGQGVSTQEMVQQGLKMSPEEVNQHVSDLMQGTGDIVKQGQAVRAEEARLSQRSNELSKIADANPNDVNAKLAADNAFKDLTDFHNGPVGTLKSKWHATGMELQGEIPVDLSTYNGMREAWLKDTGKPPSPEVEPTLRKAADRVAKSNGEADASVAKVGAEVQKATSNRKLPTYEQVRNNILERLKSKTPCN